MDGLPQHAALRDLGKRALARLISLLEREEHRPEVAAFLDEVLVLPGGHVLGLTGPPGVGKSTLTNTLIQRNRQTGRSVAVLAIDPSSQATGGALLGDRTRLKTDPDDMEIFVRSMAAGRRLGGLSDHAFSAIALLRARFDLLIVETVGTGQSEGDLAHVCDTLCLCMQPGAGDSLQFMKAGIMELPHIIAVTKADLGAACRRTAADISGALSLSRAGVGDCAGNDWTVPVLEISSSTGAGLELLEEAVAGHRAMLMSTSNFEAVRTRQHVLWLEDMVRQRFGTYGLERLAAGYWLEVSGPVGLFTRFLQISRTFGQEL